MIDFAERKADFMGWFEKNHGLLENRIRRGDFSGANEMMQKRLSDVLPGVPFRFSRLKKDDTFLLEFNTQLIPTIKAVVLSVCGSLPEELKSTWQFCASHPACRGTFEMDGKEYTAEDILLYPKYDDQKRKVSLLVEKTEKLKALSDKEVFTVIYVLLTDYIGENAVTSYAGQIQFLSGLNRLKYKKETPLNMAEFADSFSERIREAGWPDPEKLELAAQSYKAKTSSYEIRTDITEGTTLCPDLLSEEGLPQKPRHEILKKCGIGLYSASASFDYDMSKDEKKSDQIRLEKQLRAVLDDTGRGMVINTAVGNAHCYGDYMLFDQNAIPELQKLMSDHFQDGRILNLLKEDL
ncbi:MAG: hypothetical protein IJ130_07195 [Solobacterium sp.]|nr:hypothetical protein [Solobacterium sp.]